MSADRFRAIVRGMQEGLSLPTPRISIRVRSAVPGRYRIWIAGLYRNEALQQALERGLNGAESGRTVAANAIAGTVLVSGPRDARVEALVSEIETLVHEYAARSAIALDELEQRGRRRPVYLAKQ